MSADFRHAVEWYCVARNASGFEAHGARLVQLIMLRFHRPNDGALPAFIGPAMFDDPGWRDRGWSLPFLGLRLKRLRKFF
jgi:hypothetical protein